MKNQFRENFEKNSFDANFLNKFSTTKAGGSLPTSSKVYSYSNYEATTSGGHDKKTLAINDGVNALVAVG
jgi:hypothetical protein